MVPLALSSGSRRAGDQTENQGTTWGPAGRGRRPLCSYKQRTLISPHVRKDLVLGVCRAEVAVLPEPAEQTSHSRTTAHCSGAAVQGPRGDVGQRGVGALPGLEPCGAVARRLARLNRRPSSRCDWEVPGCRTPKHTSRGAQGAGPGAATPRAAPELWRHGGDAGSGAGARRCRATGRT